MSMRTFQNTALLLMRIAIATIFIYVGGYGKLFFWTNPPEGAQAYMLYLMRFLSIVEPLGGLAVLVGFLTRWAATGLGIIMVGALFFLRIMMSASFFTSPQGTGMDYVGLILVGCVVLMAFGGGSWTIDAKWRR